MQWSVAGLHAASRLSHSFQAPRYMLHSDFHHFLMQFITSPSFAFNLLAQLRYLVFYLLYLLSLLFFIAKTTMVFILLCCCTLLACIVYSITGYISSVSSTSFNFHFILSICLYVYILFCIF